MELKSILEDAKTGAGVPSLRQLADFVGASVTALSRQNAGHGYPRQETMVNLCKLGGHDQKLGLLYLGYWTSKGEAKVIYKSLVAEREATLNARELSKT